MLVDGVARFDAFPDRLRRVVDELEQRGISQRTINIAAGKSKDWLGTVLRGDSADPSGMALARVCEEYGYNVRWLLTGLGPRFVDRRGDELAAAERDEPPPKPRGTQADEAARRMLEGRPPPKKSTKDEPE